MTDYGITQAVLGAKHFLPITAERFAQIRSAKKNLVVALSIEEKLVLLLENYAEYECELLGATLDSIIFRPTNWSDVIGTIHLFNRRLVNLLTASRLYLDHVQHDIGLVYGSHSEIARQLQEVKSAEYDSKLGYRVMEALRNYVQHRGLPIGGLQFVGKWDHDAQPAVAKNSVFPYLKPQEIREDGGFKPPVLLELEGCGAEVNLNPLIREYMEGIGAVHTFIRATLEDDLKVWDNSLIQVREEFEPGAESVIGLVVVLRQDGRWIEQVQIVEDLISRRKWLQQRTSTMTHFSKHIITNQTPL